MVWVTRFTRVWIETKAAGKAILEAKIGRSKPQNAKGRPRFSEGHEILLGISLGW